MSARIHTPALTTPAYTYLKEGDRMFRYIDWIGTFRTNWYFQNDRIWIGTFRTTEWIVKARTTEWIVTFRTTESMITFRNSQWIVALRTTEWNYHFRTTECIVTLIKNTRWNSATCRATERMNCHFSERRNELSLFQRNKTKWSLTFREPQTKTALSPHITAVCFLPLDCPRYTHTGTYIRQKNWSQRVYYLFIRSFIPV